MNEEIETDPGTALSFSWDFNPYEYWPLRLTFILFGYSTIIVPGYFLIAYVKRKYEESNYDLRQGFLVKCLILFAIGRPEYQLVPTEGAAKHPDSKLPDDSQSLFRRESFLLLFYFLGIQLNHVSMGFFQEKIITQGYPRFDDSLITDKFGDAQFLVLINRLVALILCGLYLIYDYRRQPYHVPAFYKYSLCSISNTLSTWCQYESLKFVSFPAMTVCKASKLIPTMLMGRLIRNKSYSTREYVIALILVAGACTFFLSSQTFSTSNKVTTASGIILMIGYLAFDSFTPNWQKKLLDCKPSVSKSQMMFGVNSFSAILCLVSLLEQGTLFSSISFALTHDGFSRDAFLLSLSGACGQVFIYAILKQFSPEVLAVIMTLRQIVSIVVSSLYFSHPFGFSGIIGLSLVFGAIFYSKYTEEKVTKRIVKT